MKENELSQPLVSGSSHYIGTAGSKYFAWQNTNGTIAGRIEARKFNPYIEPTDSVLDFGCGGGHILQNIECARRVGIDLNLSARTAAATLGIECHEGIASVPDGSFDVIISNHSLEHVLDPIAVLADLRSKLRPAGVLLLCVPMDDWRMQRVYDRNDINHHLCTWTPQLLGNSLLEAGFDPEQFSIRILTHACYHRALRIYGKVPAFVFDLFCRIFSVVTKRRQLLAVARKSS